MATHELKIDPEPYLAIIRGLKSHEWRKDDRGGYAVGDILVLREWQPTTGYTGNVFRVVVTYVSRDYGVPEGWCVMSVRRSEGPSFESMMQAFYGENDG